MIRRGCDYLTRGSHLGRSDRGLFHGKGKVYGSKISFSHRVSRRSWSPNVFRKTFRSDLLDVKLKIPITTKAMRCIDKSGSLDGYVLKTRPDRIASNSGMELKGLLIPKWEAANKRPYDRRQLVYEQRMEFRILKGHISKREGYELINKSRMQLATRRKWPLKVPLLPLPAETESAAATTAANTKHDAKQLEDSGVATVEIEGALDVDSIMALQGQNSNAKSL